MTIVFAIAGFVLGVMTDDDLALPGAALGFVLGLHLTQRRTLRDLAARLRALEAALADLHAERHAAAAPRVAPPAPELAASPSAAPLDAGRPAYERPEPEAATVAPATPTPPAPTPPEPAPPVGPHPIDRALEQVRAFILGGNTLVRLGVVILLFGVGFLVKYAAEHAFFPVEARLAGATLLGAALLAVGWRVRTARAGYAMSLQGGGIAVVYVVVFAALRLYDLLPAGAAFALFALLGAATALLALLQDAAPLAVLAVVGGFLAPILASTGQGNHVALFGYYALLDLGILAMAWFRPWRALNLLGFLFTFVVGAAWGVTRYSPEHYASAQLFLVLFFLLYAAIAVLYAWRQPPRLRGLVDGTLVFGLPVVAFTLQAGLVHEQEFGLAASAVLVAAFYLGAALALLRRAPATLRPIVESFVALGVAFATMAIPFALDARWTAGSWALEGAALVWVGTRQARLLPRLAGVLLQLAAGFALLSGGFTADGPPLVNAFHTSAILLSVGGFVAGIILTRPGSKVSEPERVAGALLAVWALGWHLGAGVSEIDRFLDDANAWSAAIALLAATALACELGGRRLASRPLRGISLVYVPALPFVALAQAAQAPLALAFHTYAAWVAALLSALVVLRRQRDDAAIAPLLPLAHGVLAPLLAFVLAVLAAWHLDAHRGSAFWPAAVVAPAVAVMLTGLALHRRGRWPLAAQPRAHLLGGLAAVALALVLWTLWASWTSDGQAEPLSYVPLLSVIDIAQAFALLALLAWLGRCATAPELGLPPELGAPFKLALALLSLVWVTAMVARSVHRFGEVPFEGDAMMDSVVFQATLSIAWTSIALAVMTLASRRRRRAVWVGGAVLLAAVVLKLFTLDLSSAGTLARIVSFVIVGLLLLLIGWISPVPPRRGEATT